MIFKLRKELLTHKIQVIKNKIAIQIKKSFDFAINDKFPEVSSLQKNVYAQ